MSTYFGWQRTVWIYQLLMQYEIFWQGMHYELMRYEIVNCIKYIQQFSKKLALPR